MTIAKRKLKRLSRKYHNLTADAIHHLIIGVWSANPPA